MTVDENYEPLEKLKYYNLKVAKKHKTDQIDIPIEWSKFNYGLKTCDLKGN